MKLEHKRVMMVFILFLFLGIQGCGAHSNQEAANYNTVSQSNLKSEKENEQKDEKVVSSNEISESANCDNTQSSNEIKETDTTDKINSGNKVVSEQNNRNDNKKQTQKISGNEVVQNNTAGNNVTIKEGTYEADLGIQVLALVNAERTKAGLASLNWNTELVKSSDIRSKELTVSFSHVRPDGTGWDTVSSLVSGENAAFGQNSAQAVFDSWMKSDTHKDNILFPSFTQTAVSCYYFGGTYYWIEEFGY